MPIEVTRERRLQMAIEAFAGITAGMRQDLDVMKRWHAPSKRGSNYTRALESLESRLAHLEDEAFEVMEQIAGARETDGE